MRPTVDMEKIKGMPTMEDILEKEYGEKRTCSRDTFDRESLAWYNAEDIQSRKGYKRNNLISFFRSLMRAVFLCKKIF